MSKIDSTNYILINTEELEKLKNSVDSIIDINKTLISEKSYFSDIIETQMGWFAIIFTVTFSLLGLSYWLGIHKYLQRRINELTTETSNTKSALIAKISQRTTEYKRRLESEVAIINSKFESINHLSEERFEMNSTQNERLSKEISEMISRVDTEVKELLDNQKEEYEKKSDDLLDGIYNTSFDTKRAMFFACYNDEAYSSAITWIIPMMSMIVTKKVPNNFEPFVVMAEKCAQQAQFNDWDDERIEELLSSLKAIEKGLKDQDKSDDKVDDLQKIVKIRQRISKAYYSNLKIDKDEKVEDAEIIEE